MWAKPSEHIYKTIPGLGILPDFNLSSRNLTLTGLTELRIQESLRMLIESAGMWIALWCLFKFY